MKKNEIATSKPIGSLTFLLDKTKPKWRVGKLGIYVINHSFYIK